MSNEKTTGFKLDLGLGGLMFWAMVTACIGDPDLIDVVVAWIARQP